MSSEFDRIVENDVEKDIVNLAMQKQLLDGSLGNIIDAIDDLDVDNLDQLDIKINLEGKFNADLFFDIVKKYLGTPDGGAVNRIADFIGYKVDNVLDTFNYTELEDPSGKVYNIVVAIDYDLVNNKTVVNPTFHVYADEIPQD